VRQSFARLFIALLALVAGCCGGKKTEGISPPSAPMHGAPNRHLIFSPSTEETLVSRDYGRVWPAAVDSLQPVEIIDYREIVSDRQDRWGSFEDQHYRRFDSVRTGRLVR